MICMKDDRNSIQCYAAGGGYRAFVNSISPREMGAVRSSPISSPIEKLKVV